MSAGFSGGLAVVRIQVFPDQYVAGLPQPQSEAVARVEALRSAIAEAGDSPRLIGFDTGEGLPCYIRARGVLTVDAVSTEDPDA